MSVTQTRLLAIVRIAVGALFLLRTTPLAILVPPYARFPFLGWPETGWKMSALGPTLPAWVCIALCLVRTIAALLFTIGFRARAAGMTTAVTGYALLVNDAMAYTNTLHLIHAAVLILALTDSSVAFAVSPAPAVSPTSSVWLVRALPISVYVFSGFAKLNAQWLSGKTLASLVDQSIVSTPLPAMIVRHARTASIGMAAFELALPVLLLVPISRRVALWLAAAFHLSLQLTVHPDIFGMMMIVLLIAFVEPQTRHEPGR